MAKSKKQCYISVPSHIINTISSSSMDSLLLSPKKHSQNRFFSSSCSWSWKSPKFWVLSLFFFALIGMLKFPFDADPCFLPQSQELIPNSNSNSMIHTVLSNQLVENVGSPKPPNGDQDGILNQPPAVSGNSESGFWRQPDGMGYKPCIEFSAPYRKDSTAIVNGRKRYLLVVVSGGMNQQRNQIVDAVVIARILGAALVVPILQVNVIWGDESEFSDIFDLEHFQRVLGNDVHVVSSLPSTHIMTRPVEEKQTPIHASPEWIRSRYLKRIKREGVLLLRGLDSRLSKDLPSDLQKLRCKVQFQALRFAPSILKVGNNIAERMRSEGPYLALHLRMEKDVWVRTGCLPGLSKEYDEVIYKERKQRPELLTARSNMSYHERKLAGLCPLNAMEVARLLKALEAPKNSRIYWAGGNPLGGKEALLPLTREFPYFYNKEDLAFPGELEPFAKKASLLAAIDYIVSEQSDVFMPSHGGNMGHAIQGHRAFAGHKKYITPNKRQMLPYFLNSSLPEAEFNRIIQELHEESLGQPELRTSKAGKDVTKYPVPECMCNDSHSRSS